MKLWDKGIKTEDKILDFTIGKDRELDIHLAPFDVIASIAHAKMLAQVNLIEQGECDSIVRVLLSIINNIEEGKFSIDEDCEDIHSYLEKILVEEVGESGKKIHTARSRNDQVLVALKLFYREELVKLTDEIRKMALKLLEKAEESKEFLIPGYTHMQVAMYSSFGLWFSAWAESFTEDLYFLKGAMDYVNLNPLGSAAGYGSSFPVDRDYTTVLLEFGGLHINSVNAQLSRAKTEKLLLSAISSVAYTISKFTNDIILFLNQNFSLLGIKSEYTTGSSIMPHKKNPDIFEILRAKTNRIQAREFEIQSMINNLSSGYHRDFQLLKEISMSSLFEIQECLEVLSYAVDGLELNRNATDSEIYKYLGSVDAINEMVMQGRTFRDAYREIADSIAKDEFQPLQKPKHSHKGSIGNLATGFIKDKLEKICYRLELDKYKVFRNRFLEKIRNGIV
jgi:argininosuccinate lyase